MRELNSLSHDAQLCEIDPRARLIRVALTAPGLVRTDRIPFGWVVLRCQSSNQANSTPYIEDPNTNKYLGIPHGGHPCHA